MTLHDRQVMDLDITKLVFFEPRIPFYAADALWGDALWGDAPWAWGGVTHTFGSDF